METIRKITIVVAFIIFFGVIIYRTIPQTAECTKYHFEKIEIGPTEEFNIGTKHWETQEPKIYNKLVCDELTVK